MINTQATCESLTWPFHMGTLRPSLVRSSGPAAANLQSTLPRHARVGVMIKVRYHGHSVVAPVPETGAATEAITTLLRGKLDVDRVGGDRRRLLGS